MTTKSSPKNTQLNTIEAAIQDIRRRENYHCC